MDPQETWKTLLDAYQRNDWTVVEEMSEALLTWLARGGFPPRLDQLDERAARLIVQVFCSQALAMVPPFD
jgi:hypothetical protein